MKYFTKAQIEEIRKALATEGVKDTDLDLAHELNGDELVAIVQDGVNKKVGVRTLIHDYLPDDIADGADGASAYDIWLEAGNTGSPLDFLAALKGEKGATGQRGMDGARGPQGPVGPAGEDGTVVEWNQIASTGTKIAEVTIDGTTTDVMAPAGSGGVQNLKTINEVQLAGTGNIWAKDLIRSGLDIKTINNQSIVGEGNLTISGGGSGSGTPGQSTFKSIIFVRMNATPTKPSGTDGSYANPSPHVLAGVNSSGTSVYWSDGIPEGENILWASTRKFTSDGIDQDSTWSDPRPMTDTVDYDVEFAPVQTNDATPSAPTYGVNGTKESRGAGNNRCDGLSTYATYAAAISGGMVWFDPDTDFNLSGIDWTAMAWRAERFYTNGVPGNWIIERIKGERGTTGPQGVSISSMDYLFKGGDSPTLMNLPSSTTYPDLTSLANIGWVVNSSSITLSSSLPYLWCFLRIAYTDGTVSHVGPWCVRYFNQELNIDYEEVATRVIGQIDSDLADIKTRLNNIDGPNSDFVHENGLTQILNSYIRYDSAGNGVSTFRGFADAVFNAEEASIKASAGSEFVDRLAGAGLTINGIAASLQAAATKQELSGAVSSARSEWQSDDDDVKAALTNSVTKAQYIWYNRLAGTTYEYNHWTKGANETFEAYELRVKELYGKDGNNEYYMVLRLVAEEMSIIKQESDNILLAVGDGQTVSAGLQILKNSQWKDPNGNVITNPSGTPASGSKIILDASRVEVNGTLSAGIISANAASIKALAAEQIAATTIVADTLNTGTNNLGVNIASGLFRIYYQNVIRAAFGIENGDVVLKFYNSDGSEAYDLGPNGITQMDSAYATQRFNAVRFWRFNTLSQNDTIACATSGSYSSGTIYAQGDVFWFQYFDAMRVTWLPAAQSIIQYRDPDTGQYGSSTSKYNSLYFANVDFSYSSALDGDYIIAPELWTPGATLGANATMLRIVTQDGVKKYYYGTVPISGIDQAGISGTIGTISLTQFV